MTRRAFLAFRVIRFAGKSCFDWAVKKVLFLDTKNEDISEFMISFCVGAIFLTR